MLVNPAEATRAEIAIRDLQAAASSLGGLTVSLFAASTNREIDAAFASIAGAQIDALLVVPDAFYFSRRVQLAVLSASYKIPTIFGVRDHVDAGGLMSYGTSLTDVYRQVATYTARILKGDKPADLPVIQSAKFEFVINLHTASILGFGIPPTLLARAEEVIE
jgi:putative ABC transport system substrate-binding protein